jgi:hypothetical protein
MLNVQLKDDIRKQVRRKEKEERKKEKAQKVRTNINKRNE